LEKRLNKKRGSGKEEQGAEVRPVTRVKCNIREEKTALEGSRNKDP